MKHTMIGLAVLGVGLLGLGYLTWNDHKEDTDAPPLITTTWCRVYRLSGRDGEIMYLAESRSDGHACGLWMGAVDGGAR